MGLEKDATPRCCVAYVVFFQGFKVGINCLKDSVYK
jgi:hypothetical protein